MFDLRPETGASSGIFDGFLGFWKLRTKEMNKSCRAKLHCAASDVFGAEVRRKAALAEHS